MLAPYLTAVYCGSTNPLPPFQAGL